eukprot:854407-Heterocapsa_arctica.AAC.1
MALTLQRLERAGSHQHDRRVGDGAGEDSWVPGGGPDRQGPAYLEALDILHDIDSPARRVGRPTVRRNSRACTMRWQAHSSHSQLSRAALCSVPPSS